jgi:membrane protease YdiL (CAAX protease family)
LGKFPGRGDILAAALCLPALALTGFLVSLGAAFSGFPAPEIPLPEDFFSWTATVLACLSAAYLEEGYFRVYLPEKLAASGFSGIQCFCIPVLVFALCHVYEGPWGFANALLAGVLLSLVYQRTSSFHGIAAAHGLYNILAYLSAARGWISA